GMAVVAGTGDSGTSGVGGQSWPADIPEVVAASGTSLQINNDNTWANETVWANSGGGCSTTYSASAWQSSLSNWASGGCGGNRAFGDLSADADPSTGAAIVIGSSWFLVGGTSLSSPLIAGMFALGNDLAAGTTASSVLYQNAHSSALHDTISGNDCLGAGQQHCTAGSGFDTPTGLGAPRGLTLFQSHLPEDFNQDGHINLLDFSMLASKYGQSGDSLGRVDANQDGTVNLLDFSLLASRYGSE
ncbi:MAG TPA: dockerin type I domain-containing protein, partial [Candidatus Saccharimonadia bacterium]|nr:dockerin type I domain-containing protein [Candidatus Saccharimonadia bacterium]